MMVTDIFCYIISIIIVIITACLIIVYWKTVSLHSYPCYFNILLSLVISLDNILRLIPLSNGDKEIDKNFGCQFQAFVLLFFDKFMLAAMTVYSTISFLGVVKFDFYKLYEKLIFIISIVISFVISLFCAVLFMLNGVAKPGNVCYANSEAKIVNKKIIDSIITSFLGVLNVYFLIHLLFYIFNIIKENKNNKDERKAGNYLLHFWKFLTVLIIDLITFITVILIINDIYLTVLSDYHIYDLSYVIMSLIVVLLYTINSRIIEEFKKILCCKEDDLNNEILFPDDSEEKNIEFSDVKEENSNFNV